MKRACSFGLAVVAACSPRPDAPVVGATRPDAEAPDQAPRPREQLARDGGPSSTTSSSAGPSAAPSTSAADAALLAAPALTAKWSASISAHPDPVLAMVGARQIVVALDRNGQAMSARDARDGVEVWKTAAPPNVTWSELPVGRTHAYGVELGGATVAVRLADGGVAWSERDLSSLATGRDGTGLSVGAKTCGTQLVDPASGRRFPSIFPGHVMRYHPMRGEDGTYQDNGHQRCMATLHLLGQRGGSPIAVVEDQQRRGAKLGAIDTSARAPTFRWSVAFASPHVFVARIEERGAVVWTEDGDLVVVRVDFGAGNVAWRRALPHREHCAEPRLQVRMVDDALVAQSCNTVMRLDPKTGSPLWSRDVGEAVAALEGETMPPGDYGAFAERGPRPFVVQWLDRVAGTPKARVTIPSGAHDMALARDGALFLERKESVLGVMGMIGLDGAERWRRGPALFGYTAVGRFVATGWERGGQSGHAHALIDPRTGDVAGIAPRTNHVVGVVPERTPELLLASGADAVTAFVLPTKP